MVSFFLIRYERGRRHLPEAFRHEIAETRWLSLAEAPRLLAYRGERRWPTALAILDGDQGV